MDQVKFNLTQSQIRKLAHAMANNIDVTVRLNNRDISPTGHWFVIKVTFAV